jgi:hypothetical protein
MLAPSFIAPRIRFPCGSGDLNLFCNEIQNQLVRFLVLSQNTAGISEIAHENGNTKAVVIAPMLPHKCEIGLGERE